MIDLSGLHHIEDGAFQLLRGAAEHASTLRGRTITKQAVVVGDTAAGFLATGYYGAIAQPHHVLVGHDRTRCLSWLGETSSGSVIDELERSFDGATAGVRTLLQGRGSRAVDIDDAARSLGMSRRALQRALATEGTSFRVEVARSRISRAKDLLMANASVLTVSAELELSPSSFTTLFRQLVGTSPAAWKKQAGQAGARTAKPESDIPSK